MRIPRFDQLSRDIFDRVDWTWLSEDTTLLPHGWLPEAGFLPYRWDYYSELMMMYLLGMGSASHPLKPEAWDAWKRNIFEYDGLRYIGSFAPLFVHQYSQAWFDFRGKRDRYADYFQNSAIATDVHRRFCVELGKQFPDYSDDLWGITASDSDKGYVIWGGPPAMGPIDGTVVPSAAGGSLPFLPQPVMRVLRNIRTRYPEAWSTYGFVNAFNPLNNLVRQRCGRHRHRNHTADGGKCAHRICLGHLHEKPRGSPRHAARRIQDLSASGKSETRTAVHRRQSGSSAAIRRKLRSSVWAPRVPRVGSAGVVAVRRTAALHLTISKPTGS